MAIDPVSNGSLNALKPGNLTNQAEGQSGASHETNASNASHGDSVRISEQARELARFTKAAESAPSPNEGRLDELRTAIASGDYPTQQVLDDTASILTSRLT